MSNQVTTKILRTESYIIQNQTPSGEWNDVAHRQEDPGQAAVDGYANDPEFTVHFGTTFRRIHRVIETTLTEEVL